MAKPANQPVLEQATLLAAIPTLPKALLHDHLDGGLRPQTVIDLAADVGHQLPATDAAALADWFLVGGNQGAPGGSLERYLETFVHTTAVMQTAAALTRVACEAVLDLAADHVIYTEQRWAPEQHLARGLTLEQAVAAVQAGLAQGMAQAAAAGRPIVARQLLCAMRQGDRWSDIAELTIDQYDPHAPGGVVGMDLAGPEQGFPPSRYPQVWQRLLDANVPVTIHAGEVPLEKSAGLDSIASAIHDGHALRLGHGVAIIEDATVVSSREQRPLTNRRIGPLAQWVLDRRIPLEVAPSSNLQTGIASSIATHPITALKRLGFAVTLNTDNRLMSHTSMSHEMRLLVAEAGWTAADLSDVTKTAVRNAFIPDADREVLVKDVIVPGYAQVLDVDRNSNRNKE